MTRIEISDDIKKRMRDEATQRTANSRTEDGVEFSKWLPLVLAIITVPIAIPLVISIFKQGSDGVGTVAFVGILLFGMIVSSVLIAKYLARKRYYRDIESIRKSYEESIGVVIKGEVLFFEHPDGRKEAFEIPLMENLEYEEYNTVILHDPDTHEITSVKQIYSPHITFRFLDKKYRFPDYYEPSLYKVLIDMQS